MELTPYVLMTIAFAGIIHGGFSLGTSMLTLLSGHSLSRRRSHARVVALTGSFVLGSLSMILLLTLALTYAGMLVFALGHPFVLLALATLTALAGIWVTFFYYRREKHGVALWLPRSFARYLSERTAHTKNPFESFVLGGASVLYELPVTIWPILITAAYIPYLSIMVQVPVILGYSLAAIIGLLVVFMLIGGGHTGASLTRFRAKHKKFIQVIIGLSMILLGASVFMNESASMTSLTGAFLW